VFDGKDFSGPMLSGLADAQSLRPAITGAPDRIESLGGFGDGLGGAWGPFGQGLVAAPKSRKASKRGSLQPNPGHEPEDNGIPAEPAAIGPIGSGGGS
jgi:hypothetical protein